MKKLSLVVVALLFAGACSRPEPVDTTAAVSPSPSAPEPSPSPTIPVTLDGPVNFLSSTDLSGQGSSVTVDMTVSEEGFDPTFIKVSPLAQATVNVTNTSGADRTFTVDRLGVDRDLPAGPLDTFSIAAADESPSAVTIRFQLPSDGVVVFYDQSGKSSGMQGAFYFDDGATQSPGESSDSEDDTGGSSSGGSTSSSGGSRTSSGGGSSSSSQPSSTSPGAGSGQTSQSSNNPNVDPLDAEIMCAVSGDCPQKQANTDSNPSSSGESKSEPAKQSNSDPGTSEKSQEGESGGGGAEGDSGEQGQAGQQSPDGKDGEQGEVPEEVDFEWEFGPDA